MVEDQSEFGPIGFIHRGSIVMCCTMYYVQQGSLGAYSHSTRERQRSGRTEIRSPMVHLSSTRRIVEPSQRSDYWITDRIIRFR